MKSIAVFRKTKFLKRLTLVFVSLALGACMKEKNLRTFTMVRPEYKVKQEIKDAVKITDAKPLENPGSFVLYNNTMYIVEKNSGIHVLDYSNPSNPQNRGFIPIPGNTGIAIKNDVLYADCYCDLFAVKLLPGNQVKLQGALTNAFSSRLSANGYDDKVVEVTWHKKDTTVTEAYYNNYMLLSSGKDVVTYNSIAPSPNTGGGNSVGSSMAVFAIVNDFLYTVDQLRLNAFSISDPLNPKLENSQEVSWMVETIFPFSDKLFVGSMSGMFMYSIKEPAKPSLLGQFSHARVCDPVIADDKFAYVTLRNGNTCGGFTNELDVINIENTANPVLVRSFPFTNPHGLSKDGNVLFVCDGNDGLRIVDATDPSNLITKQTITTAGVALDVLASRQLAFVMLTNAIQIYSYDQQFNIKLQGSIAKQ